LFSKKARLVIKHKGGLVLAQHLFYTFGTLFAMNNSSYDRHCFQLLGLEDPWNWKEYMANISLLKLSVSQLPLGQTHKSSGANSIDNATAA